MAFSSVIAYFQSFIPGSRLLDGGDLLSMANILFRSNIGITAHAGGNAAAGTQLQQGLSRIDTVASAADSLRLPPAIAGARCLVWNNTANSAQVFGQQANQGGLATGDQIVPNNSNVAAAVGTGVALGSAAIGLYTCFQNGTWKLFLTA